jgi:predicted deacylase
MIDPNQFSGTLILVPCINVRGILACEKNYYNQDLKRKFSTRTLDSGAQFTRNLMQKIYFNFQYHIDLRTGLADYKVLPEMYVNVNRNIALSTTLANLMHPPILVRSSEKKSVVGALAAKGIPSIEVVLGEARVWQPNHINLAFEGIQRILSHLNMYVETLCKKNEILQQAPPVICEGTKRILTSVGGLLQIIGERYYFGLVWFENLLIS